MEWIPTIITLLSCLGFGGVISGIIIRQFNKMDKKAEKREEAQKKTSALLLKSMFALGNLSKANTIALKNGKANGETESALKNFEKTRDELNEHLIEISTEYK